MMAKFVKVDLDKCISCGACYGIAPEIFDFNDEGKAISKFDDNKGVTPIDDSLDDLAVDAMESCPTEAIIVKDEEIK
jgi:ferredoxin